MHDILSAESFLEYAFLRWIFTPAAKPEIAIRVKPQYEVTWDGHTYRIDYAIVGQNHSIAIELDGFTFHGSRAAFSYDRLRQNDLHAAGWRVIRFSYDMIRHEPARCVAQLQSVLNQDPLLATYVIPMPLIEQPDMDPDPLFALTSAPRSTREMVTSYFDAIRNNVHFEAPARLPGRGVRRPGKLLTGRWYPCRLRHVRRRGQDGARCRYLPGLYQTQSNGDYAWKRHSRHL